MTELNIRLLLVGDSCVGKTSLLLQYTDNVFLVQHNATIGIEYKVKNIEYKGFNVKLQIWDTAGQERFHCITNNYFHTADGIFFIYDITNQNSFEGVKKWIKESENLGNFSKKLLIGNKCDLEDIRSITKEELDEYCKEKNISYLETSAKDNINLKEAFNKIIDLILEGKSDEEIIKEFWIKKSSLSIISNDLEKGNKKKIKNKNEKCC